MTETAKRTVLPLLGHTRGKRSPVTCQLKCGSACAGPECNTSGNGYFRDIASAALSRRSALGLGAAAAVTVGVVGATPEAAQAHGRGRSGLSFAPIAPVPNTVDDLTVPEGFDWSPIIRWGDPLFEDSPEFDPLRQTPESQAAQFGYNSDYLDILQDRGGRSGVLVNNHEYTNENLMFPAEQQDDLQRVARVAMAAHGMSVVEIARTGPGRPWSYVRGGARNRRITLSTPFAVDGPAAGSALLRTQDDPTGTVVLGTQNNCAGGTTPWGTVLSGEENFNQYFKGNGSAEQKRYGIAAEAPSRRWHEVDPRFDSTLPGYENEPNRFGWVVELDPQDPASTPVKHTALGRFKHEGANVRVAEDGTVVAYSGDDERFDYLYKFVSAQKYVEGDRAHNMTLLSEGNLYVAKFTGDTAAEIDGSGRLPSDGAFDGSGEWLPLVVDGESAVAGMSVEEVLVFTRLAADQVGATKMDRPEDVEPSPHTGKVYVALTNNTDRGTPGKAGPDEANPRTQNRDGHVIEITERHHRADATEFGWNILLVAGDPAKNASTYFSGYPVEKVSPISCPDNLAFDSEGNLWISTDGAPGTIGYNDGLFKVGLSGRERGNVEQFLAVPQDAETCGPVIHDRERMVYVAVQHPGEDGSFEEPRSYFPDYVVETRQGEGEWSLPRPSVAQVFAVDRAGEPEFPGAIHDRPGHGRNQHKRRKNGERGPRYRGYKGKATAETKAAARTASRSY
ncbi:PhoX family protein [Kocuria rosea]|uniref:PhoX family protein n=1 Tax=Kocuria rosea TaxID=1275 RepID=UPI002B24FD95|nr:PhoX family phosphatase [Kocuria rosea]MEB2526904.1 PhoX family phosphatase [Kocuria rosea]MEB2618983.1 PhoX family phosphatase [Kocuria rosea]